MSTTAVSTSVADLWSQYQSLEQSAAQIASQLADFKEQLSAAGVDVSTLASSSSAVTTTKSTVADNSGGDALKALFGFSLASSEVAPSTDSAQGVPNRTRVPKGNSGDIAKDSVALLTTALDDIGVDASKLNLKYEEQKVPYWDGSYTAQSVAVTFPNNETVLYGAEAALNWPDITADAISNYLKTVNGTIAA